MYTNKAENHHQYKHGKYGTSLYKKWSSMKNRCLNPNHKSYKNYGGRGIKVCDKWLKFEEFYEDMHTTFKEGLSIERIDYNGNYCKENCAWITMAEQAKNKRNNHAYELNGVRLLTSEWDKKLGLESGGVQYRIEVMKWPLEKALSLPAIRRDGVSFDKDRKKWVAYYWHNKKNLFVGRFLLKEEAQTARAQFIKDFK